MCLQNLMICSPKSFYQCEAEDGKKSVPKPCIKTGQKNSVIKLPQQMDFCAM